MLPMPRLLLHAFAALLAGATAAAPASALTLLTEENPPFNYTDKGKLTGSASDIVSEMATRAGVPVKFEVLPWDLAYVRTQGQREICLFATARLENRERLFLWVGPIATNLWAVFGKGDFAPQIRTLKDLAPYRIGTVLRDAKAEFLRENGVNELRSVREDAQNPPLLFLPRDNPDHIDLWITSLYSGREVARAAKVTDLKLIFIASEQPLFLACSPQTDRKVVKALGDALETMKADGTYKRITAEYEKRFPQ
ncbi:MAG: transporter substrate-binding domain-containing protein [Betaproteobacteria bacterium]